MQKSELEKLRQRKLDRIVELDKLLPAPYLNDELSSNNKDMLNERNRFILQLALAIDDIQNLTSLENKSDRELLLIWSIMCANPLLYGDSLENMINSNVQELEKLLSEVLSQGVLVSAYLINSLTGSLLRIEREIKSLQNENRGQFPVGF